MKLYIEDDKGQKIEVTPLRDLGSETDIIILMSKRFWTKEGMAAAEEYYSYKLGKRVVIIDGAFDKICGIVSDEPLEGHYEQEPM